MLLGLQLAATITPIIISTTSPPTEIPTIAPTERALDGGAGDDKIVTLTFGAFTLADSYTWVLL